MKYPFIWNSAKGYSARGGQPARLTGRASGNKVEIAVPFDAKIDHDSQRPPGGEYGYWVTYSELAQVAPEFKRNPAKRNRIEQAARRLKRFSGHDARHVESLSFEVPDTALLVGPCLGIMYETVRDGERIQYVHRFNRNSRPHLAASHDGKFLILLGGAYQFTERGIVDKGPSKRRNRQR